MKNLTFNTGLLGVIFALVFIANTANASRVDELKVQISEQKGEISEIEKEIDKYQGEINKTHKEADTLNGQIRRLSSSSKKLNSKIRLTKKKVTTFALNIEKLSIQIKNSEKDISNRHIVLADIIKKIDESDNVTLVELLLSKDNLSDFFNEINSLDAFKGGIITNLKEVRLLKKNLGEKKKEEFSSKKKTEELKSDLVDQVELVQLNKNRKNKLLKDTKNKESNYKKILVRKQRIKEGFEKELRDFESKLKIEIDPSSIPPVDSGILSWPLDYIYITQKFGRTVAAKRLYVSGSHNGVDFRARTPKKVFAMADGIVIGSGDTDKTCDGASFGKWILVDYENGLASTFGHLSLIKVKAGDRVSRGQTVGYTGNTGRSTGPHLHVTVYAREGVAVRKMPSRGCPGRTYTMPIAPIDAYLDPLDYIHKS